MKQPTQIIAANSAIKVIFNVDLFFMRRIIVNCVSIVNLYYYIGLQYFFCKTISVFPYRKEYPLP